MTQYSYSRVSLFEQCPHHFKLRYIDKLTELNDFKADNALLLGTALHLGAETNKEQMLNEYFNSYPVVTDEIITESIKLEVLQGKVKNFLQQFIDDGCELIHEYKIDTDDYVGYVDLIVKRPNGECLVVDFKYSNNTQNYIQSGQLHIYKYYLEKEGFNVTNLGYLFCPKISLKMKKRNKTNKQDELVEHFRKRIKSELETKTLQFIPISFNEKHVAKFHQTIKEIEEAKEYPINPHDDCFQCLTISKAKSGAWFPFSPPDYLETIQNTNGEILMKLPSTERRSVEKVEKRVFWLYGAPFSGKTTFANSFPNPIMLNTDGNIRFVDAPYISIANQVENRGRITKTTLAWDILKDSILELEKKDNDFKTVVVDLLEDTYESCRLYMYDKLGIEHESDDSFRAWDKVRTEFLSTMKRIVHLPYENIILLSHEDTSKDITKKGGDKTTAIKPNLSDKPALKIAGMVDIVARVTADDDSRKIVFKSKDYVFGGGRIKNLPADEINLDYDELVNLYDESNKNLGTKKKAPKKSKPVEVDNNGEEVSDEQPTETKKRKSRKKKEEVIEEVADVKETAAEVVDEIEDDETPPGEETVEEELPKRKRRERKTEEVEEPKEDEAPKRRRRKRGEK